MSEEFVMPSALPGEVMVALREVWNIALMRLIERNPDIPPLTLQNELERVFRSTVDPPEWWLPEDELEGDHDVEEEY